MLEPFVECAVKRLRGVYSPYMSPAQFTARVRAEYEDMWRMRTDGNQCAELCRRMRLPGRTPDEFAVRVVDAGSLGLVIAGIHFFGLDAQKPFVGVLAMTRDVRSRAEIGALCTRLTAEFGVFQPRRIWLFVPGIETAIGRDDDDDAHVDICPDQRLFIGHVPTLLAQPAPSGYERISLAAPSPGMYQRYVDAYERLFAQAPQLRERLPVEQPDSLANCALCFEAWIDGAWAGLIAADAGDILGLSGHFVLEQILHANYRGRGLAPALQRHLLERLPQRGDHVLWGYVDASNWPSRKTAARVGRVDVGGYVFASVDVVQTAAQITG